MATLNYILERIESKKLDFTEYNFAQTESNALTTFFDLAQEFESIEDFHKLCIAIPKVFFNLDARLYLIDPKINELALISKTEEDGYELRTPPPHDVMPNDYPYYTNNKSLVLTVRGKKLLIDQLPFTTKDDVLGLLEIYPVTNLGPHQELFFEKYANRIGFNIHNRFLFEKNIEHLRFIRFLVADIEHNIIAPNIAYRFFIKHLRKKIVKNVEVEKLLNLYLGKESVDEMTMEHLLAELTENNRGLMEELGNIEKHYKNMSLFLETLLRRSHFDKGQLTLLTKPCNMNKDVVQPQLDRFIEQFKKMGISIDDQFSGIPDEEVISVVDVGLIAQVYANLFSNALKYTQEMVTQTGETKKYIAYGREVIKDYFGAGKDGVKYNVFSAGPHINPEEREKIFEDEYRGSNVSNRPGTGHGLSFIKNAVEIHGGTVGYEATQYGNNFFFILPR
ncbi:MAG: ATP-binding protein [Nitrospirota bacterium]|nr:ATP-binding protein [Nitrospirota bacterium]